MKNLNTAIIVLSISVLGCKSSNTATSTVDVSIPDNDRVASASTSEKVQTVTVGDPQNNSAVALILGSDVGGSEGVYISRQMDIQASDLGKGQMRGMRILRVGEGIKITCDGNLMFTKNSSVLSDDSKKSLDQISIALKKYNNTKLVIEGHTDGSGSATHNHVLSEQRAQAVANYLTSQQVAAGRIKVIGRGESQPLFANKTEEGRRQNRRVEIVILADDALKKEAKSNSASN